VTYKRQDDSHLQSLESGKHYVQGSGLLCVAVHDLCDMVVGCEMDTRFLCGLLAVEWAYRWGITL
jgi:hypothetical protein